MADLSSALEELLLGGYDVSSLIRAAGVAPGPVSSSPLGVHPRELQAPVGLQPVQLPQSSLAGWPGSAAADATSALYEVSHGEALGESTYGLCRALQTRQQGQRRSITRYLPLLVNSFCHLLELKSKWLCAVLVVHRKLPKASWPSSKSSACSKFRLQQLCRCGLRYFSSYVSASQRTGCSSSSTLPVTSQQLQVLQQQQELANLQQQLNALHSAPRAGPFQRSRTTDLESLGRGPALELNNVYACGVEFDQQRQLAAMQHAAMTGAPMGLQRVPGVIGHSTPVRSFSSEHLLTGQRRQSTQLLPQNGQPLPVGNTRR